MKVLKILRSILILLPLGVIPLHAQTKFGATGLLSLPTADMQKDKTFLFGGNMLHKKSYAPKWRNSVEYTPYTYNYYVNITIFPWLETSYLCSLVKGGRNSSYWPKKTWGKFVNQDRSFIARLRVWKEGWGASWTPQFVIGAIDPINHKNYGGGEIELGGSNSSHLTRYYLALTKHYPIQNIGTLGAHAAYVMSRQQGEETYTRAGAGINFQMGLPEDCTLHKMINGFNLMAEYDASQTFNVGAEYSIFRNHINLTTELFDMKYFSMGVYFRVIL